MNDPNLAVNEVVRKMNNCVNQATDFRNTSKNIPRSSGITKQILISYEKEE